MVAATAAAAPVRARSDKARRASPFFRSALTGPLGSDGSDVSEHSQMDVTAKAPSTEPPSATASFEDVLLDILLRAGTPPLTRLRVSARVARDDPTPVTLRAYLEDAAGALERTRSLLGPRRRRGVVVDGAGFYLAELESGGIVTMAEATQALSAAARATSTALNAALAVLRAPDVAATLTCLRLERVSFLRDLDLGGELRLPHLNELAVIDSPLVARVRVGAHVHARSIVVRGNGMLTEIVLDPPEARDAASVVLESLDVSDNDLADVIDVRPRAAALRSLKCDANRIIDVVGLRECAATLRTLRCDCNHLTTLAAVTALTALTCLTCTRNNLGGVLDVGPCAALEELWCDENDLRAIALPGSCEAVAAWDDATAMDAGGGGGGADAPLFSSRLRDLRCSDNLIEALDFRGCGERLTTLRCNGNLLNLLDVSGCAALTTLSCDLNHLYDVMVFGCTSLRSLTCTMNRILDLNLGDLPSLEDVEASHNGSLQRVTIGSAVPALRFLTCVHCPLQDGVDVRGCGGRAVEVRVDPGVCVRRVC